MPYLTKKYKFYLAALEYEADECLIWPWDKANKYARIMIDGVNLHVPRMILEHSIGKAPTDYHVSAHDPIVCNNMKCVNKRHLRWATQKENLADRNIAGTNINGERNGRSIISAKDIPGIRADTRTLQAIADDFNVHLTTIYKIKYRKIWKHV